MSYLVVVFVFVIGVLLLVFARSVAVSLRRARIARRDATPFRKWKSITPTLSSKSIELALEVIAEGLHVDKDYLRPEDRFDDSLALRGAFIIDEDDASADAADILEARLAICWKDEWHTVEAAVIGIATAIETG